MDKKYTKNNKFKAFLKKNIYYIIMALCIMAIAAMITLTVIAKNKANVVDPGNQQGDPTINPDPDPDPTIDPDPDPDPLPIIFALPSQGNIALDFTIDTLVWHSTLQEYRVHTGIDFLGKEGDSVFAAYGGVVESVSYDALDGNKVVILHENNLRTIYCSLEDVSVSVGAVVTKGQAIGTMGITSTKEMATGAHVHFMVTKNNKLANPYDYFKSDNK